MSTPPVNIVSPNHMTNDKQPWLAPTSPDIVWFRGADALRFLNDLISQEISDLGDGESKRSFLLGPQGKLDHLLWVARVGDSFALITDSGRGEDLASTLSRYRIRVDVDIEVEDRPVFLVIGEHSGIDVSWQGESRYVVVGDEPQLPKGEHDDYEALRIRAAEPVWGVDVNEDTIPHETGLVGMSVDFDKGCFLGQELVARMDARGANPPRRLRMVVSDQDLQVGASLTRDGEDVGVLTSVSGSRALATLKRDVAVGDTLTAGAGTAVVVDPR